MNSGGRKLAGAGGGGVAAGAGAAFAAAGAGGAGAGGGVVSSSTSSSSSSKSSSKSSSSYACSWAFNWPRATVRGDFCGDFCGVFRGGATSGALAGVGLAVPGRTGMTGSSMRVSIGLPGLPMAAAVPTALAAWTRVIAGDATGFGGGAGAPVGSGEGGGAPPSSAVSITGVSRRVRSVSTYGVHLSSRRTRPGMSSNHGATCALGAPPRAGTTSASGIVALPRNSSGSSAAFHTSMVSLELAHTSSKRNSSFQRGCSPSHAVLCCLRRHLKVSSNKSLQ